MHWIYGPPEYFSSCLHQSIRVSLPSPKYLFRESKNWTEIHHLKPLLRCFLFDAEFLLLYFCCSNSLVKTYNWNTICAFVRSRHLLANSNSTNLLSKAAKGRGRKGRLDKKRFKKTDTQKTSLKRIGISEKKSIICR